MNKFVYTISNVRVFDIIDILIIAYIVYKAIEFLRETRAGQLVKGIVFLLALYAFSIAFELAVLRWLLSAVFGSAIVAIAIIFQPELRRLLERVGQTRIGSLQSGGDESEEIVDSVNKICKAAGQMQKTKTGALIVFERKTQLGEIINTGTVVDAAVSESLVNNIFYPKSPLHDGAVIVRDGRIYAASCILPLTQSTVFSSQLGTRHRAAIGMTENSDAIVLIVSEETGTISIAFNGEITRNYTVESAFNEIKDKLVNDKEQESDSLLKRVFKKVFQSKDKKEVKTEMKEEEKDEI
ncbi:MAG: diadenylate cyclase CdaA [Clostridia bacterium]|nr:diadenylate cyclase CdaA [Clostridia bacterium]